MDEVESSGGDPEHDNASEDERCCACPCAYCGGEVLKPGEVPDEDFDIACATLHDHLRKLIRVDGGPTFTVDVPFAVAPTVWKNEVETMVRDVIGTFGLRVEA